MSHFIVHKYRNTVFRYQTIYYRDKRQWFAQGGRKRPRYDP
jgi:hypothetical protein